jgi:hypothetical protein
MWDFVIVQARRQWIFLCCFEQKGTNTSIFLCAVYINTNFINAMATTLLKKIVIDSAWYRALELSHMLPLRWVLLALC